MLKPEVHIKFNMAGPTMSQTVINSFFSPKKQKVVGKKTTTSFRGGAGAPLPRDIYGQPEVYRWKSEYDCAFNISQDGTWKEETL